MARPKRLQTKGYFSVISRYGKFFLVFRGKHVLMESCSRQSLYTERARYSFWLSCIVALLKLTDTKLNEVD